MAILDIEFGREVLEDNDPQVLSQELKEMEMVLQNSSYGHEYALMELQESQGLMEQEEIHNKLENYKQAYFQARQYFLENHPERLKVIEIELADQKNKIFKSYSA